MFNCWILIGALIIFLVGFGLGRKLGLKEGIEDGLKQAPLKIKLNSLETGKCIICGITKNFQDNAGKLENL